MKRTLIAIAVLQLAGCGTPPRTVAYGLPPLDSALAAPCVLSEPPAAAFVDYDARDDYYLHTVLPALADCARRKAAIVNAWERARQP